MYGLVFSMHSKEADGYYKAMCTVEHENSGHSINLIFNTIFHVVF